MTRVFLAFWFFLGAAWPGTAMPAEAQLGLIDVHFHAHPQIVKSGEVEFDTDGAARLALETMDAHGIGVAILMPPPMPFAHRTAYDYTELKRITARNPARLVFFGGGGTLNGMIQNADPANVSADQKAAFEHAARAALAAGARGFGELTALHLSLRPRHPFEASPPDHPLFLLLADIAAEHGVPIDLHMEAVARDRPTPPIVLERGEGNPDSLEENITALDRLLAHNRKAAIIWSHAGWDNTGHRVPRLLRRLLTAHSNLYMSIKLRNAAGGSRRLGRKGGDRRAGSGNGNPLMPDGAIKPEWLALFEAFPDRFMIGSDSHIFLGGRERSRITAGFTAAFVRALPAPLGRAIGRDNARRLLRLP